MRTYLAAAILFLAGSASAAVTQPSQHPYRQEYKSKTFSKKALVPVLTGAGVRQLRNSPHEWGRGPAGLGKRVGTSFGTHIIKNSIEYPVAALRHEDLHYYRSDKKGFGPRLKHALVSTVVTRKTTNGKKTVASGKLSGAFGSGLAATAMSPAGFSAVGGVASGGITLGTAAGVNVAREFWPRKNAHSAAKRRPRLHNS